MEIDTSPRYRKIDHDNLSDQDDSNDDINENDEFLLIGHPKGDEVVLERNIGILGCISFVVGTTIGSGIFIAPKGVIENAGSVGWALVVWVISGFVCGIGGLCYAELGATFPKSGGDFTFILDNFGPLLAFLRVWTSIIAVRTASASVIAITAATYLLKPFFPSCQDLPNIAIRLLAEVILCGCCAVNCRSASLGNKVQGFFTVAKMLGLIVIAFSGLLLFIQGKTNNSLMTFSKLDFSKLPLSFYSGLFAYSGFQYLPQITEEVIKPTKTIPIGIVSSMVIVTSIFLLTNIAYFLVLTPQEIINSEAVAIDYGKIVLGPLWWTMSIVVTLSCIGSLNGSIFTTPRMFFVAAREELLPEVFSMIHISWKTPLPAILSMLPVMLLMLLSSDVYSLINYFSFMRWIFFGLTGMIIPYCRWKYPTLDRPFKVPLVLSFIFIFCAFFVVVVSLFSAPYDCGVGLVMTLSGIPVYYFGVWWENKPQWVKGICFGFTHTVQKICFVVSQEDKETIAMIPLKEKA